MGLNGSHVASFLSWSPLPLCRSLGERASFGGSVLAKALSQRQATPGQGRRKARVSVSWLELKPQEHARISAGAHTDHKDLDLSRDLVYSITHSHCHPGLRGLLHETVTREQLFYFYRKCYPSPFSLCCPVPHRGHPRMFLF